MALDPGTRFGAHEIVEQIGAGGMGEVYRATDTELGRDIAIKVLPESFGADAARVARFEQEARTLATLNHPNIAHIYGLERNEGATALVMELIEGPTLAERIAQGPISPDEALNIAMQIADALEAAHGHSIVHRDLKPANIKLKPDGTVKVLDFGIAKALSPESVTGNISPIMTTPVTQIGVILGTAAYMSPEQARGKPVDQRTDIWAFGCLLYEMLTGQLAFAGEDVAVIMARIITNETNMSSLPSMISPAVRHTIALCLEKDPAKRIADIRDVKLALRGRFQTDLTPVGVAARRPLWRRALAPAAALVVGVAIAGLVAFSLWPKAGPQPVNRFTVVLEEGLVLRNTGRPVVDLSPDGRHFIVNTEQGILLRRMDELEARAIPGTEGTLAAPFFSADGQSVVYYNFNSGLERIGIGGGAAVTVLGDLAENLFGGDWTADGTIYFGQADGIYRVSSDGGVPERVVAIDADQVVYGVELLPDGDSLLFSLGTADWDTAQIVLQSLATGERTTLITGGNDARYIPTGHILYAFENTLFAAAFDLESRRISGRGVPLATGLVRATLTGAANYGVSDDGTLVYLHGVLGFESIEPVWVYRDGREEALSELQEGQHLNPRLSPDGNRLAVTIAAIEGGQDVWVYDLLRPGAPIRITFDAGIDMRPIWTPDSRRVLYFSSRLGNRLLMRTADGTGAEEVVSDLAGRILIPEIVLPDGGGLILRSELGSERSLYRLGLQAGDAIEPVLEQPYVEAFSSLSPDGRWLAYTSDETGRYEVYVRPYPNVDERRIRVSRNGGVEPLWGAGGDELYYLSGDAAYSVAIGTGPELSPGEPVELFPAPYFLSDASRPNWDVHPDGDRFLMLRNPQQSSAGNGVSIVVVENWFEEVERLVPTE